MLAINRVTSCITLTFATLLTLPVCAQTYSIDESQIRAQLVAVQSAALSAEIAGVVKTLKAKEGLAFKRGQTLLAFNCELQNTQWQKSKAQLASAEATLNSQQRLFELNSASELQLETSRIEVDMAQADADYYASLIDKCTVPAPFDGVVGEVAIKELQYVQEGQPLLSFINPRRLQLEFIIPTRWLTWLTTKSAFSIAVDDTLKTYPATVVRISPAADPVSQSIKVIGEVDGQFAELIPGMSGTLTFNKPE
ncbi:MAG TPA: efflux RND transporter periplasmic adaptor subunit [Pseudomonadales bacterium]|nr:efflux RND transporter periplasmic adaptor subunit [Pseudomonadales bacterium]